MANNNRHDNDKRVIRTKKAIREALFFLMKQKELSSITVSELTSLANINRRTFYTHYHEISEILDEVESELISYIKKLVDSTEREDFQKKTYNIFLGLNKMVREEYAYYFDIVEMEMRGMLVQRLKNALKQSAHSFFEENTPMRGTEQALMMSYIVGGIFNSFLEWYHYPGDMSLENAADVTSRITMLFADNFQKMK